MATNYTGFSSHPRGAAFLAEISRLSGIWQKPVFWANLLPMRKGPLSPPPGSPPPRRVALISLGCPKNQVDSELILGRLVAEGALVVEDPEDADTLVINTCSFIDRARAESVEALLEGAAWKAARPGRRVIAAGCMVQRHGEELAGEIPELDGLIGLDQIAEAPARILPAQLPALTPATAPRGPARLLFSAADPRRRLGPSHSAFVKIAEGCDQRCAFCAIPTFRGRMRSRPIDDIARELAHLAAEGVQEACFIAQDSTAYGRDFGFKDGLADLITAVDKLAETPPWLRIHYLYPGRISPRLLDALTGKRKIVEYIDLPLQHAHPAVLRRMGRPGRPESHRSQIEDLLRALPGAGVRSAFIVGFPGETDDEFETLCQFVGDGLFDTVGVFSYSHEEGTGAFAFDDDIPPELKEERRGILEEIALAAALERNEQRVGCDMEILIDGPAEDQPGLFEGRWRGQAPEVDGRVLIENPGPPLHPGQRIRATISAAGSTELTGRCLGPWSPAPEECL